MKKQPNLHEAGANRHYQTGKQQQHHHEWEEIRSAPDQICQITDYFTRFFHIYLSVFIFYRPNNKKKVAINQWIRLFFVGKFIKIRPWV